MKNPISDQFFNPSQNPFSTSGRNGTVFSDIKRIVPLVSYPRSRNGWIRCLIAAYLIARKEAISPKEVERLAMKRIKEGAAGISVDDQHVYPIDLLVPDIYFFNNGSYSDLAKSSSSSRCSDILSSLEQLPVKSHHAAHSFAAFQSLAFLVRKPDEAIVSAGLLLCNNINSLSTQQLRDYADSLSLGYQKFMELILATLGSKPIVVIDTGNPYTGLLRLFCLMGIQDVDLGLFKAIFSRFPVKSGYSKHSPLADPVNALVRERNLNHYYDLLKV